MICNIDMQYVVIYHKETRCILSAIKINTVITEVEILKEPGFEVLITSKYPIKMINDKMFLSEEF